MRFSCLPTRYVTYIVEKIIKKLSADEKTENVHRYGSFMVSRFACLPTYCFQQLLRATYRRVLKAWLSRLQKEFQSTYYQRSLWRGIF